MAGNGDERLERGWERIEAKLDRVSERTLLTDRKLDQLTERALLTDQKVDLVNRKLDLTRAELRARIDAPRLELLEDTQTMLKVELGGRSVLTEAEI
jgi:hypothetical protein